MLLAMRIASRNFGSVFLRSTATMVALSAIVTTLLNHTRNPDRPSDSGLPMRGRILATAGTINGAEQIAAGDRAAAQGDLAAAETAYRLAWKDPSARVEAAEALDRLARTPGAKLAIDDVPVSRVHWQLGLSFVRYDTPHFVILSDCTPDWTNVRGEMLERTRAQFYRVAARMGMPVYPHEKKLLCVLFNDHEQYQAFAKAHDGLEAGWVAGYYATATNRVVFYNDATSPVYEAARGRLKTYEEQMRETRGRAEEADRLQRGDLAKRLHASADDLDQQIKRERMRLGERAAASATAKTLHEAVHLLAFNSGLQLPDRDYPFWLSEGLATAFETDRPGNAFGPDRPWASGTRQERFDELRRQGRLVSIEILVSQGEVAGWDAETADAMYCQSYELFTFLYRRDPAAMGRYIQSLSGEPSGRISTARQVELFRAAFGDPETIERQMFRGR